MTDSRIHLAPTVLVLSLVASGCVWWLWTGGEEDPRISTWDRFGRLYAIALEFQADRGRMPESVAEICPEVRPDPLVCSGYGARLTDAWDQPIVLASSGEEVVLRSPGPDQESGTEDDLVFSSEHEREKVRAYAGCYRVNFDWWEDFPGDRMTLRDDTLRTPLSYEALPVVWVRYGPGLWHTLPDDAIRVSWVFGVTLVTIDLQAMGDSLVGTARDGSEWGPADRYPVTAYAVPCSSGDG